MTTIARQLIVPYSAHDMFMLVNEVEDYPKFLPWCKSSRVISRSENEIHATLVLAKGGLHKAFTTKNRFTPDRLIDIELIDGPFKHLEGYWRFEAISANECKITFELTFEFSSHLLEKMFGPVFQHITASMIEAFHEEAIRRHD